MRVDILETQLFCRYFSDAIGKSDLLPVKGVSTDSRDIKKGDLFLAIKGENFDGSEFVNEAFSSGATYACLLYTSPSPRDQRGSRMPSSA